MVFKPIVDVALLVVYSSTELTVGEEAAVTITAEGALCNVQLGADLLLIEPAWIIGLQLVQPRFDGLQSSSDISQRHFNGMMTCFHDRMV